MNRAPSSRIQAASKRANERVSKSGQRSKQVAPAVCTPLAGSPLVCVSLSLLLPPSSACKHTNLRMPVLCTVVHRSRASVVLPFTKNKEMWRWWWGGGKEASATCAERIQRTQTHTHRRPHTTHKKTPRGSSGCWNQHAHAAANGPCHCPQGKLTCAFMSGTGSAERKMLRASSLPEEHRYIAALRLLLSRALMSVSKSSSKSIISSTPTFPRQAASINGVCPCCGTRTKRKKKKKKSQTGK